MDSMEWPAAAAVPEKPRHRIYRAAWYFVNVFLILATVLAIYSVGWEFSTRRYLKGFSDAVIPVSGQPIEKIEAILNWMKHGPSRQMAGPDGLAPDRDPTETLNYHALLQVCGTATNAFINLADSGGLEARRLLILDSHRLVKHVSAEVRVDGRWIVVDPAFRAILRGTDGRLLTREELMDPAVFSTAIKTVPGYDPSYTFESTAHIRVARLSIVGLPFRVVLDRLLPGWEDSALVSLLAERESLAVMLASILLVLFLILLRLVLRWYGEKRLGLRAPRVRVQIRRAVDAFLDTAS
ncbi:MAG: hypothetical protein WB780_04070 [Candidatus Acidiferrales bacterium]